MYETPQHIPVSHDLLFPTHPHPSLPETLKHLERAMRCATGSVVLSGRVTPD